METECLGRSYKIHTQTHFHDMSAEHVEMMLTRGLKDTPTHHTRHDVSDAISQHGTQVLHASPLSLDLGVVGGISENDF